MQNRFDVRVLVLPVLSAVMMSVHVRAASPQARPATQPQDVASLRRAAEAGDASAMVSLAWKYAHGSDGLAKNDVEALRLYRKAADAGDANAMCCVGYAYYCGLLGVGQDYGEAVKWYRSAADHGDTTGMNDLGACYEHGLGGLKKDDSQALQWYRKAAGLGDGGAMANIGDMYADGRRGLERDDEQAVKWYRMGADAGSGVAMACLGKCYCYGMNGMPHDDPLAFNWFEKGADAGSAEAMSFLGIMYLHGRGTSVDEKKARQCFSNAADDGDAEGLSALGWMYANGRGGVVVDEKRAVELWRKASALNSAEATEYLSGMYRSGGGGLPKDETEASRLHARAVELGWKETAADAAPPTTAPATAPAVRVNVTGLIEMRSTGMRFGGVLTSLDVSCRVVTDDIKEAHTVPNVRITEARDDSGNELQLRQALAGKNVAGETTLSIMLSQPPRRAAKIVVLRGEAVYWVGGEVRVAKLSRLKSRIGKAVDEPWLTQAGLEVKVEEPGNFPVAPFGSKLHPVSIVFSGKGAGIDSVRVLDGDGNALARGLFRQANGTEGQFSVPLNQAPSDAMALEIKYYTGAKGVTVPFEIKDIELP